MHNLVWKGDEMDTGTEGSDGSDSDSNSDSDSDDDEEDDDDDDDDEGESNDKVSKLSGKSSCMYMNIHICIFVYMLHIFIHLLC
jgi:hypothetical protein